MKYSLYEMMLYCVVSSLLWRTAGKYFIQKDCVSVTDVHQSGNIKLVYHTAISYYILCIEKE